MFNEYDFCTCDSECECEVAFGEDLPEDFELIPTDAVVLELDEEYDRG